MMIHCNLENMFQTIAKVANDIRGSLDFGNLSKNAHLPKMKEGHKEDPKFKFFNSC